MIFDLIFRINSTSHDTTIGDEDFKMAKSTYGTLQEFKPECEPITAYLERVKAYFDAKEVPPTSRGTTQHNWPENVRYPMKFDGA